MMPHAVDPAGPVEPLAESAPLAWAIAPRLCPGDPQSPSACVWYHRVWQYMRLLGVISSIRTNSAFLTRTFDGLALNHPRVLISGSADYAMLAHLWHAYAGRPLTIEAVLANENTLKPGDYPATFRLFSPPYGALRPNERPPRW